MALGVLIDDADFICDAMVRGGTPGASACAPPKMLRNRRPLEASPKLEVAGHDPGLP